MNILRIPCRFLRLCVSLTKHNVWTHKNTCTQCTILSSSSKESHCVSEAMRWIGYYTDENQNKLCCLQLKLHGSKKSQCCNKSDLKSLYCDVDQELGLWNLKKNACSTAKQKCNVRLLKCTESQGWAPAKTRSLKSITLSLWFFISGSCFEHSSEFVHYIFFFLYLLKPNRRCSLKGFRFFLVFSVLHKNSVSPECKQCALRLDDKTHYIQRHILHFYLGNRGVNVYWAENILSDIRRKC